jgi:hypothetical protein
MKVSFKKLPKEWIGVGGPYYMAKAVDVTGKWEFTYMVQSSQNLPKFIELAEQALKETCSEVVFHDGLWTKTRNEIFNQEKVGHV